MKTERIRVVMRCGKLKKFKIKYSDERSKWEIIQSIFDKCDCHKCKGN